MFNLRNIEYIIYTITFIIAYLIVETISGWFRAYIAKKMGDDTPESLGFLSLNPIVHIDPIGLLFLIFADFGWGRGAPINAENIQGPWRNLKLVCAYFSDTFAHLVMALISLMAFIALFGTDIVSITKKILFHKDTSLSTLTYYYPHYSSLLLSIAVVLVAIIYLSIILAILNFIINGFRLTMILFYKESVGLWYLDLIVPIVLILFLANPLRIIIIDKIIKIAQMVVTYIGVV